MDNCTEDRIIFNSISLPILIVDDDGRLMDGNTALEKFLGRSLSSAVSNKGGEILSCIHSFNENGGCGFGRHCGECVIRNSIGEVLLNEGLVLKKRCNFIRFINNNSELMKLLVTVSPIRINKSTQSLLFALVTIEDMTDIIGDCQWDND